MARPCWRTMWSSPLHRLLTADLLQELDSATGRPAARDPLCFHRDRLAGIPAQRGRASAAGCGIHCPAERRAKNYSLLLVFGEVPASRAGGLRSAARLYRWRAGGRTRRTGGGCAGEAGARGVASDSGNLHTPLSPRPIAGRRPIRRMTLGTARGLRRLNSPSLVFLDCIWPAQPTMGREFQTASRAGKMQHRRLPRDMHMPRAP